MNNLENSSQSTTTTSTVSDWAGMPIEPDQTPTEFVSESDKTTVDVHDLTKRMFDLLADAYGLSNGLAIDSSTPTLTTFVPHIELISCSSLDYLLELYSALSWDSIDVLVSLSDPQGLAGGIIVGFYPYRNWNNTAGSSTGGAFESLESTRNSVNSMALQRLFLSPEAHAMFFGQAKDITFRIPWTFNRSHIFRTELNLDGGAPPLPGMPVLYVANLGTSWVTSVQNPGALKIFLKFNNLKFLGPLVNHGDFRTDSRTSIKTVRQSGMEGVAAALAVDAAITAGTEIVSDFFSTDITENATSFRSGAYEEPEAVQLAYIGDSTSTGFPQNSPIFDVVSGKRSRHLLIEYLKRPQYLKLIPVDGSTVVLYTDVVNPTGLGDGPSPSATWFNWFSQFARYWRGTLIYDLVIMGHPMVNVAYNLKIDYPQETGVTSVTAVSNTDDLTLQGIANGVHRISVPMPFLTVADYVPVIDQRGSGQVNARIPYLPSRLISSFKILSTMLDVQPTLSVAVFIRAGEDFLFYWPRPPGLYDIDNAIASTRAPVQQTKKKKNKKETGEGERLKVKTKRQVNLTATNTVFETRATVQKQGDLVPLIAVEDFFDYWCRALPYNAVDGNDEPIATATLMNCPSYFPIGGDSASYTPNVNNSWYVTQDYLSILSSSFMYFRGSIGVKVVCSETQDEDSSAYKYIALDDNYPRQLTHNPFTAVTNYIPTEANFGAGAALTPWSMQPVLDVTLPYRSLFRWSPTLPMTDTFPTLGFYPLNEFVETNVNIHDEGGDLIDSLFRKGGADYQLAVDTLLPPPFLWRARGYNWS